LGQILDVPILPMLAEEAAELTADWRAAFSATRLRPEFIANLDTSVTNSYTIHAARKPFPRKDLMACALLDYPALTLILCCYKKPCT
jgi:hypothetical protein